jgi:vacuolar protein sorting-associated protein 54
MLEIAAFLEGENWNEVEIPAEMLQLIEERRAEIANRAGIPAKPPQFSAVASTLLMYRVIWDYVRIIEDLEVPSEANARLIEAVKLFSSRSCQLVLGAGATILGKVKTITSKMLGMSAQALQFIVDELQFIQHKVVWRLPETDYDKLKKDLVAHERMIFEKLASILNERFIGRYNSAKSLQWESMLSPEQLGKDYYCQQISADLVSMHSSLHGVLSSSQLKEVFGQVFMELMSRLTELYSTIPITSSTSAQRVVNDAQHLLLTFREKVSSGLQEQVSLLETSLEAVLGSRCRPLL